MIQMYTIQYILHKNCRQYLQRRMNIKSKKGYTNVIENTK